MAFKRITLFQAPPQLKDITDIHKKKEGAGVYIIEGTLYIIVARGKMPTGGYSVSITAIEKEERCRGFNILVEYKGPEPGQAVTQMVTYPFVIVRADLEDVCDKTPFKVLINGVQKGVHTARCLK